jgi:hypothetical protein
MNGRGMMSTPSGEGRWMTYTGDFRNGKRDGHGTLCFPNGDRFTGAFSRGERTGAGASPTHRRCGVM